MWSPNAKQSDLAYCISIVPPPSSTLVHFPDRPCRATLTQGQEVNKEYLRRLRTAVFSMEGSDCQRLRDKVMSEMVLPRCVGIASGVRFYLFLW